ncbi:MAG: hypothetical protein PHY31_06345, partial [Smithellaceae bacterium]|nr:hypothetical protein [Smithellaceae bacterium]
MAEAQENDATAVFPKDLVTFAMQFKRRFPLCIVDDFYFTKTDARCQAQAHGLQKGLFGGKESGVMEKGVFLATAIIGLSVGIDPPKKSIASPV